MLRRTPLAWFNLIHDRRRLAIAVGGIGFAVLLMFMQTGFRYALFDSTVEVVRDLDADVVIVSRAKYSLTTNIPFERRRMYQARSVDGVRGAYPLYIEPFYATWKPAEKKAYPIRVLAYQPGDPVFALPDVQRQSAELRAPFVALVDVKSKEHYRLPASRDDLLGMQGAELCDQQIRLVGRFRLGTDFANDGNLIMSAANFARYFPQRAGGDDPLNLVDVGVVQLVPGADPAGVVRRLKATLPNDVDIYTKDAFVNREIQFWARSTPIGYIFTVGVVMGFVVGVIICYQLIYTDIGDHLPEFATLKAMGYGNRYFINVVLCQSLYLSLFGFVPGLMVSLGAYVWLAEHTGLVMRMTCGRAFEVLVLTTVMCVVSGCLAMRKVLSTDPAELFA
jgi:putative ABC transport system permease protein